MQSKGLSRVFSTPQIKSTNLKLLYFMGKETYTRFDELRPSAACDHKSWRRHRGAGSLCFPCWRCRGRSSPVSRRPGKGATSSAAACLILPCAGLHAEPFTHGVFCDPFYTPGGKGVTVPISQMRTLRLREAATCWGAAEPEFAAACHSCSPCHRVQGRHGRADGERGPRLSASPGGHVPPAGVSSRRPPATAKSGAGRAGPRGPPTCSSSASFAFETRAA